MTKRFKNAYDALVKAYFNDHLEYSDCAKCAVGNIVAHSNNYRMASERFLWINEGGESIIPNWDEGLDSFCFGEGRAREEDNLPNHVKDEIRNSQYSMQELALIEKEFADLNIEFICQKSKKDECLYRLIEFIASLDGDTLELEENPFEKTEELAYEMVIV